MSDAGSIFETANVAAPNAAVQKHIVEELIEERAKKLRQSKLWPFYKSILYPLLRQPDAVRMADDIAHLPGKDIFDYMSALLDIDTAVSGLEHVPGEGRVIIAATHPTGIADGIAMYDALGPVRRDLSFFANRDAIRVAPRLSEMLIPVEWVAAKRTRERSRETLTSTVQAFTGERCIVLFPSGRIAYKNAENGLTEQPWLASVAIFARKYDCPIVPAHVTARNSWLYYWFWKVNTELRDITLFNELLNKRGQRFNIQFGPAVSPDDLPADPAAAAEALRRHAAEDVPAGAPWRTPA
ncbi:MAG TPA: 1-acyl-sn-glycerol-3-phosphate acyltransferase [Parvularculaceae bacterium]|nr:1-acyl-sn-glycerol-3-phosphate acyltransferase [Parvularculaceae bacterium]